MFDMQVFSLTVETVAFLQIFILTGYFLRRKGMVGHDACKVISVLTAYLFLPAYTLAKLPQSFTMENLGTNAKLLGFSLLICLIAVLLGRVASKFLAKTDMEKRAFAYMFAFSNTGYFGLPVVEGVFGEEVLGQFIVFTMPIGIVIHSYGWGLFASEKKFDVKKCFLSPNIIATYISAFLGLTGLYLYIPDFLQNAFSGAGACMSPCAMLLAGFVMGARPLKDMLFSLRPYFIEIIRIVSMPLLVGGGLWLCGLRGVYLFLAFVVVALPSGMNIIVFPESHGQDATENSKLVFVSTLLSILTVPVIFSLAKILSGVSA